MKTKTLVVAEIAIVLCSLFLVALPAIATDQTTQKVSANTITTANDEQYYPGELDVFGNANEDDTIDMRDTTYIKLVIFGKKPKTDFADANYDGKVSMLDVGQTKLIILGKERKLAFIDTFGKTVTIDKPLERIVALYYTGVDAIRLLGAKDRIVGVDDLILGYSTLFPDLSKLPCVGNRQDPDVEKILVLEPDAVILGSLYHAPKLEEDLKGTNIDIIRVFPYNVETIRQDIKKLGYILDEEENANKYLEWCDKYNDGIKEIVSGIPEEEKPKVFWTRGAVTGTLMTTAKNTAEHEAIVLAGGKNIAADVVGEYSAVVEIEWVAEQNPDVFIGRSGGGYRYTLDESGFMEYRNEIVNHIAFENIEAVKSNRVYILSVIITRAPMHIPGAVYLAKWFHPTLFEDWDPQAIHQEYIDEFCPGLDFDVRMQGIFVYPPPEEW